MCRSGFCFLISSSHFLFVIHLLTHTHTLFLWQRSWLSVLGMHRSHIGIIPILKKILEQLSVTLGWSIPSISTWCKALLPFYFCSLECALSWRYSHSKELIASFECLSSLWSYWFKIVLQVHSYEVNLDLFICLKPGRIYSVLSVLINIYWVVSHSQLRPRVRNVSDEPQLTIFFQLTHHFMVSRKMKWYLADVETWVLASVSSCFAPLASTSSRDRAPPWCLCVCLD